MAIIEKIQVGGSTYDIGVQGPHISGQIPVDTLPSIPANKLSGTIPEGNLPIIPASKLPSYVDDVIEGYYSGGKFYSDDKKANLIIGEKGKIYVDITTTKGLSYRCTTNDSNTQTYISINGSNNISKNVVANTASSNANAAAANGSVYLNHLEESSVTSSHKISGSGATTVTADSNGNIIINSKDTNTDTKVTSAANHYDPTKETISTLGGAASTTTAASWGTTDFITGVTIKKDPKGHITGLTLTSAQMPSNPNTDRSVTSAAYHYTPASDTNSTITKNASSSTAAGWNSTSLVTGISVYRDSKGHVTDVTLTSVKMPSNPNSDTHYTSKNVVTNASTSNANAAAANGNVYLNHLEETTVKSYHKISGDGITTVTADASGNITISTPNTNTDTKVTSAANHYGPTSDTNSTITKNASSSVSAGWNSSSLVTGISVYRDSKGHVTDVALTSVKMPSNPNTHYESKNIVGLTASSTTNTTAAIATNGIYLNHIENSALKSSHKISGSGATTVTADASGNIIISSTDRSVTSAAYHYTPTSDTNSTITKNASSTTAATWDTTSLVTGITVSRDSKGHVIDVSLTSIKMPANPNTDTHYTSKNIVANTASATANAAAGNGIYLNHIENGAIRSSHKISGSGITTVKADANGNITVNTPVTYDSTTKTLKLG